MKRPSMVAQPTQRSPPRGGDYSVNDDVPVVRDEIVNLSLSNEALDQCNMNHPFGVAPPTADNANLLARQSSEIRKRSIH